MKQKYKRNETPPLKFWKNNWICARQRYIYGCDKPINNSEHLPQSQLITTRLSLFSNKNRQKTPKPYIWNARSDCMECWVASRICSGKIFSFAAAIAVAATRKLFQLRQWICVAKWQMTACSQTDSQTDSCKVKKKEEAKREKSLVIQQIFTFDAYDEQKQWPMFTHFLCVIKDLYVDFLFFRFVFGIAHCISVLL